MNARAPVHPATAASDSEEGPFAPPDLDTAEHIDAFVDRFYARVLRDPLLAPVFLEQAAVDLSEHLPRIKAYWRKMLLGEDVYHRHMMRQHRVLDAQKPFQPAHYQRWLLLFEDTLQKHHRGPCSTRARELARRVAGNMRRNLECFRG